MKAESASHFASARLSLQCFLWQEWEEASHHQTAKAEIAINDLICIRLLGLLGPNYSTRWTQ